MSRITEEQVIAELGFAVKNYFGGCPECGKLDRILNVNRFHIAICAEHKNSWYIGANLFSSWKDESEAIWDANHRLLHREYVETIPLMSTDPCCYASDEYYQETMGEMLKEVRERRGLVDGVLAKAGGVS